ncbi:cobalt-precorrin-5B (C(1))-methyltransferase [Priestia filamentosa]|uniref:cobalt-precorrin-5B (C(1))-methyltransferase n=1 Tax=Priestia filamentosa TaxID=1402861 RepID=UPI001FB4F316|nr:cobalt-precorrin-5B (C(1))-methyltransferase [Priestia filamentosa]MED3725538.1 cobalt-precorrin-5B (C(1))-methyltransferase [Priestia filamentosa]UOE61217.1 cobalt-precorrin-5B (C(1))-methyltransferase [Priestia filamentosa]
MKAKKEDKPLREGYTTGSCATAATKAALLSLITGEVQKEATIKLPMGRIVTFSMKQCEVKENMGFAEIIKDAGDDPDATHGARIQSTVTWKDTPGIELDGGVGVGRVTKPGLPVPVGEAAINPVPRKMLYSVAEEVLKEHGSNRGIKIIISVPDGEEMAKKTLNGRLGILGGISILGTRGIVVPFSTAAYKASIVQAISVAKTSGCDHLVITTGGRSEKYGMKEYPDLPEEAFIEMGDFVGFTLKQCKRQGIKHVSMVGMMGKFSKVAQGVMMVHSKSAPVDFNFLADIAERVGGDEELLESIRNANTASQVGDFMVERNLPYFFDSLCENCCRSGLREVGGGMKIETSLYTFKGAFLGKAVYDER